MSASRIRTELLQVRVVDANRQIVRNAAVQLSGEDIRRPLQLAFNEATGLYSSETKQRGVYLLSAAARGLEPQGRSVKLPHSVSPEEFVLGKKDTHFYFRGRVKTPFEPKPGLIAVTVREGDREASQLNSLAADLRLTEVRTHEQVRRNNVRVFRYPARISAAEKQRIFDALRTASVVQFAGPVVEMFEERLVFLTNQFVVKFSANATKEHVDRIAEEHGFKAVRAIPMAGNAFLFQGEPRADYGLLEKANTLASRDDVEYAEPNAVTTSMLYLVNPTDFLVAQQWHIPLIRLPDAWQVLRDSNAPGVLPGTPGDRTFGSESIQIVVFDTGVQSTTVAGVTSASHPDFQGNVTSGATKITAFYDAVNMVANNNSVAGDHGMGCAGVAAAKANNAASVAGETEGVAGAAGNCRVVAIRAPFGFPNLRWADAFIWMAGFNPGWVADGVTYPVGTTFPPLLAQGVDIHTNSVRIPDVGLMDDALDFLATYGRGGRGIVSFLAAGNTAAPISHPANNTIADHEKVITVAASINTDVRSGYSCFDPVIDICAPSDGDTAQTAAGVPGKVTTDTVGGGNLAGQTGGPLNYRNNFGGTSSATPLAAGVGALMLSIRPNLNWVQVRELLRNTAIKIDAANTNPIGQWTTDSAGNPVFSQWYGYGRVNAAAAVQGARDFALASDVVIRDNLADTGIVPSGGWHADSPDIWVRRMNDPIPVLAYTAAPPHENPLRGQDNFIYLRVKNTGTAPTNEVYLRALICHFPGFEFRYPAEWQPSTPPSSPVPPILVPGSYLIGQERIDDLAPGADVIVKMRWNQNLIPPVSAMVGGMLVNWHPCLLAEVSPHDGPGPSAPGMYDVKRYNDLAHKNISIDNPAFSDEYSAFGVVAGTSLREGVKSLIIDRASLSPATRIFLRIDDADIMQRWLSLARERAVTPAEGLPWQNEITPKPEGNDIAVELCGKSGGKLTFIDSARVSVDLGSKQRLIIDARPGTALWCLKECGGSAVPKVSPGRVRGQDVVFFDGAGADSLELPLPLPGREFVPIAIGITNPNGDKFGILRATQRLNDGELSPGYEVRS